MSGGRTEGRTMYFGFFDDISEMKQKIGRENWGYFRKKREGFG